MRAAPVLPTAPFRTVPSGTMAFHSSPARVWALCAALLAIPAALHAQQAAARLEVTVVDSAGAPVGNARVEIAGVYGGASTDDRGVARMDRVPAGNRIVTAARIGFTPARAALEFRAGETAARTLTLAPEPVRLRGVSATAARRNQTLEARGFYQRQRAGWGAFMAAERIAQLSPMRTAELFRRMRGFRVSYDRRGYLVIEPVRGSPSMNIPCEGPLVFLDGVLMPARSGPREDMLSFINPEALAGIEAYASASAIPSEYNVTGSGCGVLLLWTKTGPN